MKKVIINFTMFVSQRMPNIVLYQPDSVFGEGRIIDIDLLLTPLHREIINEIRSNACEEFGRNFYIREIDYSISLDHNVITNLNVDCVVGDGGFYNKHYLPTR